MNRNMKRLSITMLMATALTIAGAGQVLAQDMRVMGQTMSQITSPTPWRFGILGGMNFNIVGAGSQTLEGIGTNFTQQNTGTGVTDVIDGTGLGFYFGALTEYNPGGFLGGQLRVAVDDRKVMFNDWDVPGASQTRFTARMTYLSVEPLLRLNLAQPNFHMVAGPLLSFKLNSTYDYTAGRDETPATIAGAEIPGANAFTYGVSGGFGYDIWLNSKSTSGTRWFLTPFVEASYMMDQREATEREADRNDVWVTTTVRGGFQLKFGAGPAAVVPVVVVVDDPSVSVSLRAPNSVTDQRSVIEMFPLRNYIFFENGTSAIPAKYVKLDQADAVSFTEESMLNDPGTGSGTAMDRSQRQMSVYYNAMNVIGDRMRDNPTAAIQLVGSAPNEADGLAMANNVRDYLVSTFGIAATRITTKGVLRAPHASGTRATPKEDLPLIAEENVRVEVLSDNMEIIKPVQLEMVQSDIIDNDLVLNVRTAGPVADWTVKITGEGYDKTFGPYSTASQRIDSRQILMDRASGNYTATVMARSTDGRTVTSQETFSLTRRVEPPVTSRRFSILFEYDESKTVATYDNFLRTKVAPQIPDGSTVVIHGHTDVAGLTDYNFELSQRRATEAMNVLSDEMKKLGRTVKFDQYGFGEDQGRSPFQNATPESRYYNRTVLIEVIPGA